MVARLCTAQLRPYCACKPLDRKPVGAMKVKARVGGKSFPERMLLSLVYVSRRVRCGHSGTKNHSAGATSLPPDVQHRQQDPLQAGGILLALATMLEFVGQQEAPVSQSCGSMIADIAGKTQCALLTKNTTYGHQIM